MREARARFEWLLIALAVLMLAGASAQAVTEEWVARYDPNGGDDWAHDIAVDNTGNVYVTGEAFGSGTNLDYATVKYDSGGVQLWARSYNGPTNNNDMAYAIAVDSADNVYVTGESDGNYVTIKYNSGGAQQWVAEYTGPGRNWDAAYDIAVDAAGDVYVTGESYQGVPRRYDYATVKYDGAGGGQIWVALYDRAGTYFSDCAYAIAVDSSYVYVTGYTETDDMTSYLDYTTIKYPADSNVPDWVVMYDGPASAFDSDIARDIAVDGMGNVYVTGESDGNMADYATVKYDPCGIELWAARYDCFLPGFGSDYDYATALALDSENNVYVTGGSYDPRGFDWPRLPYEDIATIKYDTNGNEIWVDRYDWYGHHDVGYDIAVDNKGSVYVTGESLDTIDPMNWQYDYVTLRYDTSNGNELWVARYNGLGNSNDSAAAIAADAAGNVYVTGGSEQVLWVNTDYATIKYSQELDGPVSKWTQLPDESPTGMDIRCDRSDGMMRTLADDFPCTTTGAITDVHFWGSWEGESWEKGEIEMIHLSIHEDLPVGDPCNPNPYSIPGQVLWEMDFYAGEFDETLYRDLSDHNYPYYEWWWDPYMGGYDPNGDQQIWQYDIYIDPCAAFVQAGDPCDPVIYWLDVYVEVDPIMPDAEFGWKTSKKHWNDDAVWGDDGQWWEELRYPYEHPYDGNSIDLAFAITTEHEPCEPNEPVIKWEQMPDETWTGIDIRCDRSDGVPRVLADDFLCETTGAINKIMFWGSWKWDDKGQIDRIHVSIHADDPCGPNGWSQPAELLWEKDFFAGDFKETFYGNLFDYEWFWDPAGGEWPISYCDQQLWQYEISIDPCEAFVQQGSFSDPVVYWLDVFVLLDPYYEGTEFGWKTSVDHWNDDAVDSNDDGSTWHELRYPPQHPYYPNSIDLAFTIFTAEAEPNLAGVKWIQEPDLYETGIDVDAGYCGMVADDFECTKTGLITDVHIWASWYYDELPFEDPNAVSFTVSIYSDNPMGPSGWSEPNELLWTRDFESGGFDVRVFADYLNEGWYWPCDEWYEAFADSICWQYDFYIDPCEAFLQRGDPCDPVVYWVAVQATPDDPMRSFGWKTSLDHWNDDAVWSDDGLWWQELRYPVEHPYYGESIDLAFAITTQPQQPVAKEPVPHLKWSQPPLETDPTSIWPIYCGWNEESRREIITFDCWGPNCPCQCLGDADCSGAVAVPDLLRFKASWGKSYPDPMYDECADFDRNLVVDHGDLIIMKSNWGIFCPGPGPYCPDWAGSVPTTGQVEYYDLFAVSLNRNDVYWNLVKGGAGTISDPVLSPDPAGIPVTAIDGNTALGGVVWGFGGADWGDGIRDSHSNTHSIELMGAGDYYLSVVLDTATSPQADTYVPSWGTISNIVVRKWTGTGWGPAEDIQNWSTSPYDPDGGTGVSGGTSSSVTLAGNDFGKGEIPDEQSGTGIWGASVELPYADGYKVEFTTDVYTWDSYDDEGPQAEVTWDMVADDFRCLGPMPISSVHWWGSYLDWNEPEPPLEAPDGWHIGFWSNVPAGLDTSYSHPGELLWQVEATADRVPVEYVGDDNFPGLGTESCFQYYLDFDPHGMRGDERFWQYKYRDATTDDIFWISITALYGYGSPSVPHPWGWKTRPAGWMDDAVAISLDHDPTEGMVLDGQSATPLRYDMESYDVCFELDTQPYWIKWEQAFTGHRNWPHYEDEESMATADAGAEPEVSRLVADDWLCDDDGYLSAIVWWGSYIGYGYGACQHPWLAEPVRPDYFWLTIWDDVPAYDPCNLYGHSHPNDIIWDYRAYDYDEVLVGFDKHPEGRPVEPVFRYSVRVDHDQLFLQDTNVGVYWLGTVAVYDQNIPNYPWGWTNHEHVAWETSGLGEVGHWKLDETSGPTAYDSSGYGNHGTLMGDPNWQPAGGPVCGALYLDGIGDYVDLGNDPTLNMDDEITVATWIKSRSFGNWEPLVAKNGENEQGWQLRRYGGGQHACFTVRGTTGVDDPGGQIDVIDREWHHVAGVYDGAKRYLYVDGELDIAIDDTGTIAASSDPVAIGARVRGGTPQAHVACSFDDVRIYDRGLGPDEIRTLAGMACNDDAVAGVVDPPDGWLWQELYDQTGESEDMSFMLFTDPNAYTCWDPLECKGQSSGDATCDGKVNLADLFALKQHFGKNAPWTPPECCADYTQDGRINLADLFALKAGFGAVGIAPSTGNQNCP
jgi:hypothetical protein